MKTPVIQNSTISPMLYIYKYVLQYYKQIGLVYVFLLLSSVNYAQEGLSRASQKKHEFRFNPINAIANTAVDIEYEYIVKPKVGVGVAAFFDYASSTNGNVYGYEVSPYYRYYFWNRKGYNARGLFVEGSALLSSIQARAEKQLTNGETRRFSDGITLVGAGIKIGQKWVIKNGFTVGLSIGGGRYIASDSFSFNELGAYVNGGFSLGYRFF